MIAKTMVNYLPLWNWVTERERVRIRKDILRDPHPWTDDPIIGTYRFCNVRREDDRVTRWINKHIRVRFRHHPNLWLMLCIARQINWPNTLRELIMQEAWPSTKSFNPEMMTIVLNERKNRGDKIYTGAYMISAPREKGSDKQSYISEVVIGDLWKRRNTFPNDPESMKDVHSWIMKSNGWGQFMAYQAVVDMRFTSILEDAKDIDTWAAAGPGTIRGLNRLHGRNLNQKITQEQALREMKIIYPMVYKKTAVKVDFSDVPNILCETDKYLRVKNGEGKPRALYVPGRGS
jgi:hypothetical protein